MFLFQQKRMIPFWKSKKVPIFCHKYFFQWKMWYFFSVFDRNTGRAGPIILKLCTKRNQGFLIEARKQKFHGDSPSSWIGAFKKNKTNIFPYFPSKNLKYSQIFFIWNNLAPRKWELRYSFCQILNFQFF